MDKRDKHILRVLERNARASLKEIAKETSIPISVVSNRLNAMRENGLIEGYRVVISPKKMGKDTLAFISLDLYFDPGKGLGLNKIVSQLSKLPNVEEAFLLTGETDAMLKLRVKEVSDVNKFIHDHLISKEYIKSVRTSIVLEPIMDLH